MPVEGSNDLLGTPFQGMRPEDGYRISRVDLPRTSPTNVSLFVTAYGRGTHLNLRPEEVSGEDATVEVRGWTDAGPAQWSEAIRLQLVTEAMTRYFNTGGDWRELERATARMRAVVLGGMHFPGWNYFDGRRIDGAWEHVFVKSESEDAVLWVEGRYLRRTTLTQLREEWDADERIKRWRAEAPGRVEGVAGQVLALPSPEDAKEDSR